MTRKKTTSRRIPSTCKVEKLGTALSFEYRHTKDRKHYRHKFNARKPVYVSDCGKFLIVPIEITKRAGKLFLKG